MNQPDIERADPQGLRDRLANLLAIQSGGTSLNNLSPEAQERYRQRADQFTTLIPELAAALAASEGPIGATPPREAVREPDAWLLEVQKRDGQPWVQWGITSSTGEKAEFEELWDDRPTRVVPLYREPTLSPIGVRPDALSVFKAANEIAYEAALELDADFVAKVESIISRVVPPQGEVERLRGIIAELADEVEAEINEDYPSVSRGQYPSYQRKYERDMEVVKRARRALAREDGTDG